ncbi:MAG: ATP-binding protein [Candidatus Aminicenantaceae bacterium]
MYKRKYFRTLFNQLSEPRKFIQVLTGPRQSGKTTLIQQILAEIDIPSHYAAGDAVEAKSSAWIEQQWETARLKLKEQDSNGAFLLVLDEIQKLTNWTEIIKRLWDEDSAHKIPLKVVLLGSSPLLIQKGISETLAGRFELIRIPHWSYQEMKEAFNFSLDRFLFFGGYPGAASLTKNEQRWKNYVNDSLIETTVSRDIFMMTRVDKPSLLRKLFELGCQYSGQILSLNKILGQLQDAGNTTTLSHYLELLNAAGMLMGLQKYSPKKLRQRSSSPKFQVLNTALISAQTGKSFKEAKHDFDFWGRLVESAVGAHLNNESVNTELEVFYWREGNKEVDFVLKKGRKVAVLEVKSGKKVTNLPGINEFSKKYNTHKKYLVGRGGLELEDFFMLSPADLI